MERACINWGSKGNKNGSPAAYGFTSTSEDLEFVSAEEDSLSHRDKMDAWRNVGTRRKMGRPGIQCNPAAPCIRIAYNCAKMLERIENKVYRIRRNTLAWKEIRPSTLLRNSQQRKARPCICTIKRRDPQQSDVILTSPGSHFDAAFQKDAQDNGDEGPILLGQHPLLEIPQWGNKSEAYVNKTAEERKTMQSEAILVILTMKSVSIPQKNAPKSEKTLICIWSIPKSDKG